MRKAHLIHHKAGSSIKHTGYAVRNDLCSQWSHSTIWTTSSFLSQILQRVSYFGPQDDIVIDFATRKLSIELCVEAQPPISKEKRNRFQWQHCPFTTCDLLTSISRTLKTCSKMWSQGLRNSYLCILNIQGQTNLGGNVLHA